MAFPLAAVAAALFSGLKKIETVVDDESIINHTLQGKPSQAAVPVDEITQAPSKREIDRALLASGTALAISSVGLLFTPFNFLIVPLLLYALKDFFRQTYYQLKQGKITSQTLTLIILSGALLVPGGFFMASILVTFFLFSARGIAKYKARTEQELEARFSFQPDYVWQVIDNTEVKTPFGEIKTGATVVVHSGQVIPVDGVVIEGSAYLDESLFTGDSETVEKVTGDTVLAASKVTAGKLYVKVEASNEQSTIAQISAMLDKNATLKSSQQMRADALAQDLAVPALVGATLALPVLGLNGALAILNAHPREKMGNTASICTMQYLDIAIRHNIMVKDGTALEALNQVDVVMFDKTGILTEALPGVGMVHCLEPYYPNEILAYAAAALCKHPHEQAKAILREAQQRNIKLPPTAGHVTQSDNAVAVTVYQNTVQTGPADFMAEQGLPIPDLLHQQQQYSKTHGYPLILVAIDGKVCGGIELKQQFRPEAWEVVHYLKQHRKQTCVLSNEHELPTQQFARKFGIDRYFAQVTPEEKIEHIQQLQAQGRKVCYIGDGIRDAQALQQADVSISLNGATTLTADMADIVFMDKGLAHLPVLFDIAEMHKKNLDMSLGIMLAPVAISIGGAIFLHYGLAQSIALKLLGSTGSTASAILPALSYKRQMKKEGQSE